MIRTEYDEYIRRFNEEDPTAFDDYLAPDMHMLNGGLEFIGIEGMREHYQNRIWPFFREQLNVLRYISDETTLAVQMWTHFIAKRKAATLFGAVEAGEVFDYRGIILYDIRDGLFSRITVAYNSFVNMKITGEMVDIGMPH